MESFLNIVVSQSSEDFLAIWLDRKQRYWGLYNWHDRNYYFQSRIPTIADCYDLSTEEKLIVALEWDSGKIVSCNATTGSKLTEFYCHDATDIRLVDNMIRVHSRSKLRICRYDGVLKTAHSVVGALVFDGVDFIIVKTNHTYSVYTFDYSSTILQFQSRGLGVTSVYSPKLENRKVLVVCESRGPVSFFDLEKRECLWSANSPAGYHPIHCGFFPGKPGCVLVIHADLKKPTSSVISAYDQITGEVVGQAKYHACPSVAAYSPLLGGFLTGTKELVELNIGQSKLCVSRL